MVTLAEEIRQYAKAVLIEPARRRGEKTVTIRVGDVHRAMGLTGRVPAVCQALTTRSFLESSRVEIEKREGPPSGQSTSVSYTYRLLDAAEPEDKWDRLLALKGAAKEFYAARGRGEAVVRAEGDEFEDLEDRSSRDGNRG